MFGEFTQEVFLRDLKGIKGFHTAAFILFILLLLSVVSIYVPEDGWDFSSFKLKFLSSHNIVTPREQEKADIDDLLESFGQKKENIYTALW